MALKSILSPKVKVRLRGELSGKWQSVEQWQRDLACLSNELDIERYTTNVTQITLPNVYIDCNRVIKPNKSIYKCSVDGKATKKVRWEIYII